MPKIVKIGPCFVELFIELHWHSCFLMHGIISRNKVGFFFNAACNFSIKRHFFVSFTYNLFEWQQISMKYSATIAETI